MNKSKFLKKSLAMLLALMLVVAMIPLSAAAAQQPAISQAWVSDGSKARLDISGSDITGSISESARSFDLEFMVSGDVSAFYYYDQSQSNAPQKKVDLNGSTATISGLNVLDYEDESGNIVVRVSAANSVGTANYTVTLTPAAVSVNTDIDTLYVGVVTGSSQVPTPQLGPTTFDGATIKVTVPYKDLTDGGYYIIQTLELASETAVAKYIDKDGTDKGVIVPGTTQVQDGGQISVTNNGQTKNYPLEITVAYGVTSLSFKEAVDTIVFPDDEKIAVLLPYGYTSTANDKDKITVTPEFELDYPSATASWGGVTGSLTSGETEISLDEGKVIDDKVDGRYYAFFTYQDPKGNDTAAQGASWEYRKANFSDNWYVQGGKGFIRSEAVYEAIDNGTNLKGGGTFTIHYSDTTERTYNVYFFETRDNDKAVIESLTIGSETATIDQDAKTIDITLPAGTDAANLQLNDPKTALTIKASDNATVEVPETTANPNVDISEDSDSSRNLTNNFTSSSKLDASDEVIVRITSQDKLTVNDYRLNVTVASDYVAPQLTDVALQSRDGTNFEPVEEKADGTIVFEVPYTSGVAPYGRTLRADLNGWKFFYTKTVGSSATFMNGNSKTAMPLTGSKMVIDPAGAASDSCDYIPTVADGTTGAIITVSAKASNGSIATKEYKIQINRVDPDDNSVLTSFDLGAYGTDYTYFTETFKGSVKTDEGNKSGEIVVELPWSLYQDPDLLEDLSAMAKSANDKEKIFVVNSDGSILREIGQVTETVNGSIFPSKDIYKQGTGITADGHDKNKVAEDKDTYISLVVLSERAWANMTWTKYQLGGTDCYYAENWKNQIASIDGDDLNLYTEYKVWINQADPKEEATLSNMVLIDGSGWQANLSIDVNGKKISGNIPYALTTDLKDDGTPVNSKDVNPIYLDYTLSPRAFVLAADENGNPTQTPPTANVDTYSIPVSGQNKDVRFTNYDDITDIRKYTGAYLLISRDGDVYVYQNGNKVAGVTSNQLAATNEDGKKVYNVFNVDLRVNEPNTGAEFSSFALNGYTGTIDQEKDTITVTLPFGTEYTYLTPTYSVSSGATVYVDDPEWLNVPMFSGKYQVNFTAPRQFTVISESENVTTTYTVNVVVSDEFSDVKPGDWFYNNVMDAVANGYMAGEGQGIFNPMGKTTRAAFASTIANALGYKAPEDPSTVTTRFKDVPSTHWGAGAIAFCVENEIIGGYDDGTFRPDQAITRQEAAAILNNAFGLTASTDVSKFTDANRIASWATAHVAAVANAELMNGDVDGAFRPTSTLTRAELASIMMNAKNHGYID